MGTKVVVLLHGLAIVPPSVPKQCARSRREVLSQSWRCQWSRGRPVVAQKVTLRTCLSRVQPIKGIVRTYIIYDYCNGHLAQRAVKANFK